MVLTPRGKILSFHDRYVRFANTHTATMAMESLQGALLGTHRVQLTEATDLELTAEVRHQSLIDWDSITRTIIVHNLPDLKDRKTQMRAIAQFLSGYQVEKLNVDSNRRQVRVFSKRKFLELSVSLFASSHH